MIEVPFATQEGKSDVRQNSQESLLNMFAEIEVSGRSRLVRRQRAGLAAIYAIPGEKRCIERFRGIHYAVVGPKLYSFDGTTLTELGELETATGRCTMIFNENDEIMISDGETGYYWDGVEIGVTDAPEAVGHLAYQGGFGIFNVPGSGRFYVTQINDFTTVDPLDFASAESYPDDLVRVFVDHNEVWLFGERSTEIWQLSGGVDFPFSPMTGAAIERGIAAPFSVAAEDNTVFWLGDDRVLYRAEGYRPQRVSTHPVERALQELSDAAIAAADAFVYTQEGHKFYTIRFPGELTLQYNIATGFWNRAGTFGHDDWQVTGSAGHVTDYLLTPAGIARLDPSLSTDEGGILARGGRSAPVYNAGQLLTFRSFWLDAEMGRAAINQPANVMLRVARDGESFGNERVRSLGATGQFNRRAIWRSLGQGRRVVFDLMMTDPTPFKITGAGADIGAGR